MIYGGWFLLFAVTVVAGHSPTCDLIAVYVVLQRCYTDLRYGRLIYSRALRVYGVERDALLRCRFSRTVTVDLVVDLRFTLPVGYVVITHLPVAPLLIWPIYHVAGSYDSSVVVVLQFTLIVTLIVAG